MDAALDKIIECGMKVGLSICPDTPAEAVEPYLAKTDMILAFYKQGKISEIYAS